MARETDWNSSIQCKCAEERTVLGAKGGSNQGRSAGQRVSTHLENGRTEILTFSEQLRRYHFYANSHRVDDGEE